RPARAGEPAGRHQSGRKARGHRPRARLADTAPVRMIRKLIGRILRRPPPQTPQMRSHARRYRGADLGLSRAAMSSAAQRTCETLHKAGFKAYIVGGGVRDSLLRSEEHTSELQLRENLVCRLLLE